MNLNQAVQLGQTGANILELLSELKYVANEGKTEAYYFDSKKEETEFIEETINMITQQLTNLVEADQSRSTSLSGSSAWR